MGQKTRVNFLMLLESSKNGIFYEKKEDNNITQTKGSKNGT